MGGGAVGHWVERRTDNGEILVYYCTRKCFETSEVYTTLPVVYQKKTNAYCVNNYDCKGR